MEGTIAENSSIYYEEDRKTCCYPGNKPWRFLGLFFMCCVSFSVSFYSATSQNWYIYDNGGMNQSQLDLLQKSYSWSIVMVFVGGFLMDKFFGIRMGACIYMGITLTGTIIFAAGAFWNIFWLMLLGRLIFGIGSESVNVAQSSYAVRWFKGKELNMVFGLLQSINKVGLILNFLVMTSSYNYISKEYSSPKLIGIVLFFASLTCLWSMICVYLMGLLDRRSERLLKRGDGEERQVIKLSDVINFKGTFLLVVTICITHHCIENLLFAQYWVWFYVILVVASPICGFIVDKTGKNVFWIILSIVGSILPLGLMALSDVNPYVCMSILALSCSMMAGSLWPSIALIVPEHQLGTAYGIALSLRTIGIFVGTIFYYFEIVFVAYLSVAFITGIILWLVDSSIYEGYMNMTTKQRKIHEANCSRTVSKTESYE